jgi:hypothetical protein
MFIEAVWTRATCETRFKSQARRTFGLISYVRYSFAMRCIDFIQDPRPAIASTIALYSEWDRTRSSMTGFSVRSTPPNSPCQWVVGVACLLSSAAFSGPQHGRWTMAFIIWPRSSGLCRSMSSRRAARVRWSGRPPQTAATAYLVDSSWTASIGLHLGLPETLVRQAGPLFRCLQTVRFAAGLAASAVIAGPGATRRVAGSPGCR